MISKVVSSITLLIFFLILPSFANESNNFSISDSKQLQEYEDRSPIIVEKNTKDGRTLLATGIPPIPSTAAEAAKLLGLMPQINELTNPIDATPIKVLSLKVSLLQKLVAGSFEVRQVVARLDKEIGYSSAILADAHSIIAVHNHPTGSLTPSPDDILTTRTLVDAGNIIGVSLLDHIIVSFKGSLSIREKHPDVFVPITHYQSPRTL